MKFESGPQKKKNTNNEEIKKIDEQLHFFDDHNNPIEPEPYLSSAEEHAIEELIFEATREGENGPRMLTQNASEIIPNILSEYNKFDVAYNNVEHSPEFNFKKSEETNTAMANGLVARYGDLGFYGKVFSDHQNLKNYWEMWRIDEEGNEFFIQGKDGNKEYETELKPVFENKERARSKILQE